MANIKISTLLFVSDDLFNDATSFLNELATEDVQDVFGGGYGGYGGYGRSYGGHKHYCCWGCCC